MTLTQTPSLLRLWTRTPIVHRHRNAPIFTASKCRSLISSKSYANGTPKQTPPVKYYQRPITGSRWYLGLVNWEERPWRDRRWPPRRMFVDLLKFTFHAFNFVCATHLFLSYIIGLSPMAGPSMLPTFAVWGDVILEDKITYALFPEKLARGDVILLESPLERGHKICKRVLGLPGDIVCVDPTGHYAPSNQHVIIPKGHIWIVGDNASMSRDSRLYGPVPMALIKARVLARIWPPSRFALFPGHESVTKLS
ncbi:hypothetical protein D9619_003039 [Psilocybe cf. subviscida]|uniref:Peptidase S26 domain-containing protein n=1 Tax=Psilocybe cf. subviscida TaxID=2480587 RepID=A0A8H5AYK8_9AGAR|nr:hypothetical protein D9619_003039 [Psilocybe cf. subviscida]